MSWTIKKDKCQRIGAFGLWCWRRLLRIPLLVRRWNQSILKKSTLNIHWKDSRQAEAAMIWPPDMKSKLIGKDPGAGKVQKQKEKRVEEDEMVRQRHGLNGNESEQTLRDSGGHRSLAWAVHGVTKSQTWLSNWTKTRWKKTLIHQQHEGRGVQKSPPNQNMIKRRGKGNPENVILSIQFICSVMSNSLWLHVLQLSQASLSITLELAQTLVHQGNDTIKPFHPLSSSSSPAFNISQHQGLSQGVSSLHQVAKVLEL